MKFQYYRKVVSTVVKECKVGKPVIVHRVKVPLDTEGDCDLKKGKFYIRIGNKLTQPEAINCFLHEAAHCSAWGKDKDDHGRNWGIAYSKVYRIFEKFFVND